MLLAALLLMAAALASWTTPSDAGDSDHELARQALQQGRVLPLRTVLDQVERDYQGQVIKVEFEHDDGRSSSTRSSSPSSSSSTRTTAASSTRSGCCNRAAAWPSSRSMRAMARC